MMEDGPATCHSLQEPEYWKCMKKKKEKTYKEKLYVYEQEKHSMDRLIENASSRLCSKNAEYAVMLAHITPQQ